MVADTWRWWLQGEARPQIGSGEQENKERHFKREEAKPAKTTRGGGGMGFGGCKLQPWKFGHGCPR